MNITNVTWEKIDINTWYKFRPDLINMIPLGVEVVYVVFTNHNNIPIANYVGRGQVKERLREYTLFNPMRARRMSTGSLYITWAKILDDYTQRNAEAYLIQKLYPIENKQRP